jgi:hypothetical protein
MAISDDERFKLRYGPYKTPRFKYGKKVQDEWRGKSTPTQKPQPHPIHAEIRSPAKSNSHVLSAGLEIR